MHRCGTGSRRNGPTNAGTVIPCSCGFSQGHVSGGPGPFSILFAMPDSATGIDEQVADTDRTCVAVSAPSSVVDCTLSLGTPSTRQSGGVHKSCTSTTLRWDIISSHSRRTPSAAGAPPIQRGAAGYLGGDALLARRCANCDTTSTPLWRNGPRGPKSLCNACGIRYKKEERRSAASTTTTPPPWSSSSSSAPPAAATSSGATTQKPQQQMGYGYQHHHPWTYPPPPLHATSRGYSSSATSTSLPSAGGYHEVEEEDAAAAEAAAALPYLSWRLNVPTTEFQMKDGPRSLLHDFT